MSATLHHVLKKHIWLSRYQRPIRLAPKRMNLVATTSVAAAQTFDTTELLEHISTSLDVEDLVHAQRVNRQWRDVITGSKRLRPNLFLAAAPCKAYLYWKRPRPDQEYEPYLTRTPLPGRPCYTIAQPHPAFRCTSVDDFKSRTHIYINYANLLSWRPGPWENMFLTQPPCCKVSVHFVSGDGRITRDVNATFLTDEEGIRLGALKGRASETAERLQETVRVHRWTDRAGENRLERVYIEIEGFVHQRSHYVSQARINTAEEEFERRGQVGHGSEVEDDA